MNQKLWASGKSGDLDKLKNQSLIDAFTVGKDYLMDKILLPYDLEASKAHAKMLLKIGVLSESELESIELSLNEILKLHKEGNFEISAEQEDMHTAIEQFLTAKLGDTGKKIHTGRSRNDQVLVAIRLYMKDKLPQLKNLLSTLILAFETKGKEYNGIAMPGYTHMQKAMPTDVSTWLTAFAQALEDQLIFVTALEKLIDQNPLGSGAGFGFKEFKIDRDHTSEVLGFAKTQSNPLYCGLSRGLFEYNFLNTFAVCVQILSRFTSDLLFFTSDGRNYFSLPNGLTTGSSIMPQKRNFDVAEILRGKCKLFLAGINSISTLQSDLLSGYNRDISLIKSEFLQNTDLLENILKVSSEIIDHISPNTENLAEAMTPDLFATDEVYKLVQNGMPFRDAYKVVKEANFS